MSSEMETGGLASLGGLATRQKADLSGRPCQNCATPVPGRFCPACGQLAASFHRPAWMLAGDILSDSLALDGRIARTLPALLFRPGRVTRRYIDGARARFVPPFRLFLLASLLFFFVLFAFIDRNGWFDGLSLVMEEDGSISLEQGARTDIPTTEDGTPLLDERGEIDREALAEILRSRHDETPEEAAVSEAGVSAASERLATLFENQRLFFAAIQAWAPRLSLLLLPLSVLALAVLHAWRRGYYLYDHAVHALHLHAWFYLAASLALLAGELIGAAAALIYLLAVPVYVGRSLAITYRSGFFMSALRTLILCFLWMIGLVCLIAGVVAASLFEL